MLHLKCGWAWLVGVAYSHSAFSSFVHIYLLLKDVVDISSKEGIQEFVRLFQAVSMLPHVSSDVVCPMWCGVFVSVVHPAALHWGGGR